MSKFIAAAKGFVKGEEGATMVEYALMVALIAVVCIGAVTALGSGISGARAGPRWHGATEGPIKNALEVSPRRRGCPSRPSTRCGRPGRRCRSPC